MITSLKKKIGILGVGQYGTKIQSKLQQMNDIVWAINSDTDFTNLEIPEWVFIATPNIFHFEQAEYFLKAGANVFIEKPATLDPTALSDLIQLSLKRGRRLYVDDVFLYRTDLKLEHFNQSGSHFVWYKDSSGNGSLLDRFTYHHMYLLFEMFHGKIEFKINHSTLSNLDKLDFAANINGSEWKFSYASNSINQHTAFGVRIDHATNDALSEMLTAVLNESVSFNDNHKRAIWATTQICNIKKDCYKRIAVVGGGIFGTTVAVELADTGYNVVLFERNNDLMKEASSINQCRVHKGYHYPRSIETATECKAATPDFEKYYNQALLSNVKHQYAIAKQESMTNSQQFTTFMETIKLPHKKVNPIEGTDLMIEVDENLFDSVRLTSIVKKRLKSAGVELRLNTIATEKDLREFDFTIIATYANLNDWCDNNNKLKYQYELCEKPVLKLPEDYRAKSIVILDGPFMCIDPFGNSDLHVMGNVVHAIHHTNIGYKPIIPNGYNRLLNKGVIKNPSITNIKRFIESARPFFPDIDKAQHIGSMYTIRTVLPNHEKDDARPTLVNWISDTRLMVFSGKICTCVSAAKTVLEYINTQTPTENTHD